MNEIDALERAAAMMERPFQRAPIHEAAATLRQLAADLKSGALVRRESADAEVVAWLRAKASDEASRKSADAPEGSKKRRDFAVVSVALDYVAVAIASGAHKPQIITGQSLHVYATWDDSKESGHVAED